MPTATGIWYMVLLTIASTIGIGVLIFGYRSVKKTEIKAESGKSAHPHVSKHGNKI
ncbi:hypothetical protein [Gorillibacterium massiliense]|uniref:hypothetical protein n=1 Tax=Gorillibacterium massiliense TaxID=1280390 RepID=UPI0004BAAFE8|nr:hypothetical protein [Gorillibacterium massiliense]